MQYCSSYVANVLDLQFCTKPSIYSHILKRPSFHVWWASWLSWSYLHGRERHTKSVISSPPSAAYMRQWSGSALVQIIACRLFGAKPSLNQWVIIVHWAVRNKHQWNFNQNTNLFINDNAFELCRLPKWRLFCLGGDELISYNFHSHPCTQMNVSTVFIPSVLSQIMTAHFCSNGFYE